MVSFAPLCGPLWRLISTNYVANRMLIFKLVIINAL